MRTGKEIYAPTGIENVGPRWLTPGTFYIDKEAKVLYYSPRTPAPHPRSVGSGGDGGVGGVGGSQRGGVGVGASSGGGSSSAGVSSGSTGSSGGTGTTASPPAELASAVLPVAEQLVVGQGTKASPIRDVTFRGLQGSGTL